MAHIYKADLWECNDNYYVSDVSDLAASSGTWWYVPNLLSLSPVEYVKLLINKFHATKISYSIESDVLIFSFSTLEDARKYKNYVNKQARDKKFIICI